MRGVLIFVISYMSCLTQMLPSADGVPIVKQSNTGESSRGYLSSYYSQSKDYSTNSVQSLEVAKYVLHNNVAAQNEESSAQRNITKVIEETLETGSEITNDISTTELDIICVSEEAVRFSEDSASHVDNIIEIITENITQVNNENTGSQSEQSGNVPIEQTFVDGQFYGEDGSQEQDESSENESIESIQKEGGSQEFNDAESHDGGEDGNKGQEKNREHQNSNNENQKDNNYDILEQGSSETSDVDEESREKYESKENSDSQSQEKKDSDKRGHNSRKDKKEIARELASKFNKKIYKISREQRSDETAVRNDTREQSDEDNNTKEDRGNENDKIHNNLRKSKQESTRELIRKFYRQKTNNENEERNTEINKDDEFWRTLLLAIH